MVSIGNKYGDFILIAKRAVRDAGEKLVQTRMQLGREEGLEEGGKEVKLLADRIANEVTVEQLAKTGLTILSEETGLVEGGGDSSLQWVVDPLDGSVNYLRGMDYCAVSVALCEGERPVAGIVYDLNKNVLVAGVIGKGAVAGGRELSTSSCRDVSRGILATGFPARMKFEEKVLSSYVKRMLRFQKIRMFGSAVQSCLAVADGRVDGYFEQDIMLWDVAAGLAIIEAAGGKWFWKGGSRKYAKTVWACCPGLADETMME